VATPLSPLLDDLAAEHAALDLIVGALDASGWAASTPAAGWRVRDQIGHLAFFDRAATTAIVDPERFEAERDDVAEGEPTLGALAQEELLAEWRAARNELLAALAPLDPSTRIEWYGPPMGARSFTTARLMETWAHGHDVADGVGAALPETDRLRHIAHLGVMTRGWSYRVRGRTPPTGEVRVALDPPSGTGDPWSWGPPDAPDHITGRAVEFCQVVTQRRPVAATSLAIDGDLAAEWMDIAQAFAGPPTETDPLRGRRSA
jgi:uncharacterized protein (TIGR03084 family)